MIGLTKIDGATVQVAEDTITRIEEPDPKRVTKTTKTRAVVTLSDGTRLHVTQTPEEINAAIGDAPSPAKAPVNPRGKK